MKNFTIHFITFSILAFSIPSISQNYFPLLEENKEWQVFFWEQGSITPYFDGSQQFISGDTVINGMSYQIISRIDFVPTDQPVFFPPFMLDTLTYISGFIREDTLENKVYTLYEDSEVLTYDFTLSIGDTLWLPYMDNTPAVVDTILDFQLIDGSIRQQFVFEGNYLDEGNNFYIEGIGGASSLLFPFDYNFEFGADLLCVQENNEPIYGECATLTNTTAPTTLNLEIFPNPAYQSFGSTGKSPKWNNLPSTMHREECSDQSRGHLNRPSCKSLLLI